MTKMQICVNCVKKVEMSTNFYYTETRLHEGLEYTVSLQAYTGFQCTKCEEVYHTKHSENQIFCELKNVIGLLQTEEIRAGLKKTGYSQRGFAELTGIAEEVVSRWVNNRQMQSRSLDNFMRVFFNVKEARHVLASRWARGKTKGGK